MNRLREFLACFSFLALLVAACGPAATPAPVAPTPEGSSSNDFGVILMAHGGNPEWDAAVLEAVRPLQEKHVLEVAFGMADAKSLQEAIRRLEARGVRRIGVVRLFVSGESFLDATEQIFGLRPGAPGPEHAGHVMHPVLAAYMAGGHGSPPADDDDDEGGHAKDGTHGGIGEHTGGHAGHGGGHGAPGGGHGAHGGGHGGHSMEFFRVETKSSFALSTHGLIDSEQTGAILADRALALSKAPEREDVLILAHGPGDDAENERWLAALEQRAATVRTRAPFRRVRAETLREDWPDKRVAAEERVRAFVQRAADEGGTAIVIPFRVQGFGPYAKVLKGLEYVANQRGLIPHPEVARWIEQEIAALASGEFRTPQ
ncbi:MAG: hypothetical protein KIT72_17600 [Polyangiaceae bacterium]|nr:hypothetical protein [Polyangiaceae bacterium]MCW5792230.1 hypothetical protein [Polyangiaceae bacterium]